MPRAQAPPLRAEHAGGMGFIHVGEGAMLPRQCAQPGDVGAVAIHAEHAFRHDDPQARIICVADQQAFQMIEVVVPEADLPHACRHAALVQAGMVQAIGKTSGGAPCSVASRNMAASTDALACHPLASNSAASAP